MMDTSIYHPKGYNKMKLFSDLLLKKEEDFPQ